jgi:hypothetical protein
MALNAADDQLKHFAPMGVAVTLKTFRFVDMDIFTRTMVTFCLWESLKG